MRTPHTSCRRGKKVRVILRSGKVIIDKFLEAKSASIHLENTGWIDKSKLRSFAIYKPI